MKRLLLSALCAFCTASALFSQTEVSGVYVGGHIRRERPSTITKLRNSGFTYVILFNVHVDTDGTLMTDGETICKDGEYVFSKTQPYYQQDVKNLKTSPTSISRVEICIGGWGNDSYNHIRDLINKEGTGTSTILYRNFKALKEAIPEIDAVNNDDENCYDVTTAAKFHVMMYKLGYNTTLAPYTNKTFWTQLNTKIRTSAPKAVDRVMIQCYDGGAGNVNSVGSWTFTGVKNRHAGLMYYSNDWSVEKNLAQFQTWADQGVAVGGFVWVYNDESWDLNAWASGMNRGFGQAVTPDDQVAIRCYSENNYGGYCVALPEGTFTQADLARYGIKANDISSIELVDDFYRARIYTGQACTGSYMLVSRSRNKLTTNFNDKVCSIKVEANPTAITGIDEKEPLTLRMEGSDVLVENGDGQLLCVYDLSSKVVLQTPVTSDAHSVPLAHLTHGSYIIRVADKSIKVIL